MVGPTLATETLRGYRNFETKVLFLLGQIIFLVTHSSHWIYIQVRLLVWDLSYPIQNRPLQGRGRGGGRVLLRECVCWVCLFFFLTCELTGCGSYACFTHCWIPSSWWIVSTWSMSTQRQWHDLHMNNQGSPAVSQYILLFPNAFSEKQLRTPGPPPWEWCLPICVGGISMGD